MIIKKIELFDIQLQAFKYLLDNETECILYGGKANSGKSWIGSVYLLLQALTYPNTRWGLCRSSLTELKKTSLKTFIDVCKKYGYKDYKINYQSNSVLFPNGSEIFMINLQWRPRDREAHFLGGYELTGAVVEEVPQIPKVYFEVLSARIRYKLDDYNLKKKILLTCNPDNGWVKSFFYTRWLKGELPNNIKFVNAVGKTNPYAGKNYDSSLSLLSEQNRRRYDGDWEYAEASDQIFTADKLEKIFTGLFYGIEKDYYITCDPARMGEDTTVIILWEGFKIIEIKKLVKQEIPDIYNTIRKYMEDYNISKNKVIVDSTGLGQGLRDMLQCVEFHSINKPFNKERFDMLKSQLYFKLSKTDWSIAMHIKSEYKELIQRELESIRDKSDDIKYKINSKDEQKLLLENKSPDFSDAIMLRMYFLYENNNQFIFDVV